MNKKIKIALKIILLLFAINVFMNGKVNAETEALSDFEWTYTVEDGKAVGVRINKGIVGHTITVPDTLGGYPVASISASTNSNFTNSSVLDLNELTTVYLPSTLEEIGGNAFKGIKSLQRVSLKDDSSNILPNVNRIRINAFYGCSSLKEINFPDTLEKIDEYAFYGCENITSIEIPESVKKIEQYAFCSCKKLNNVTLPSTLTRIESHTFSFCSELSSITLPDGLEYIGISAFSYTGLSNVTLPDGLKTINDEAFGHCVNLSEITLPNGLKAIGDNAFWNCGNLTNITLPDGLMFMGKGAFSSCINLFSITLPNGLDYIDDKVFWGCKSLDNVILPDSIRSIGGYAFEGCVTLTNIEIPEGVEKIYGGTFKDCSNLKNITLPNSLILLGPLTFQKSGLTEITIPDNVETLGYGIFANCNRLITANFPEITTVLPEDIFYNCTNLVNLNISNNLTRIESRALYNCTGLNNITFGSNIEYIGESAFYNLKDVFMDSEEENVEVKTGNNGTIHYFNCKHKINVSLDKGVKIINTDTNEEYTDSFEVECKSDLNYKIVSDDYTNLYYVFKKRPEYEYSYDPESPNADVETKQRIYSETTKSESNVMRNMKIVVQNLKESGLVVRKYITKVNGLNIDENRAPVFEVVGGEKIYKHTKQPIVVYSGDTIRYAIRVYNEGNRSVYATEIKEYLPETLQFVKDSAINRKYNWVVSEDGRTVTTEYLSNTNYSYYGEIPAYDGDLTGAPYKEIEIECKVLANRDEENKYITSIAQVTGLYPASDVAFSEITLDMLEEYKKEESLASNSDSYIHGEITDFDYESIVVPTISDISTDYRIRIEKIDSLTGEMLNGAKFNLLNQAGEVLKEGVTAIDGILDFGMMNSVGEGTDTYYIEEIERPEGYNNSLKYKIKITVTKEIYDYINEKYTLDVKCDIADIDVDISRYDFIPIYTKDQLIKIGSNEEVYIEETEETYTFDNSHVYKLMQDIDLADVEWKPLDARNCMIDGNNFAIKNLKIETNLTNMERVGLFGTYSGYIGDLTLENVNIQESKESGVTYPSDNLYTIGGLVGYMSEGIIKNCKVSGEINADISNVGGFVGHSEKGKILIFNNCTNSSNIEILGYNVGGLIGCVKGAININNCTNIGSISKIKSNYGGNVGGFIGCADSEGYETNVAKASYDRQNKIITIVVKNDNIVGKYKLRLENVDIQTLKLIEGSTFDILDENKQIVNEYKGVVLKNGKLDIATIDINTIGTDVYYIKQIATPEGYEISTNEYVKVIVNKKWDTVSDRYVVDVDTTIVNDEEYEIDEVPEDVSSSKTGIIHKIMEYKNVTWTTNKVGIKDSKNEGEILSAAYNAGGLLGRAKTSIEIDNCENIASVTSYNLCAGGLLGRIEKANELSYLKVFDSVNKGIISNRTSPTSASECAGIIGYSENDNKIYNCHNEGDITSNTNTAGIIANSVGNIYIYNCSNTGDLSLLNGGSPSCGNIGGIVGQTYYYYDYECTKRTRNIIIDNCTNTGNISNGGDTGGIIGLAVGKFINITNCNSKNAEVISCWGETGGIVGAIWGGTVIIENCNVTNVNVIESNPTGGYGHTGGVLGAFLGEYNKAELVENVKINNCNVEKAKIISGSNPAGILGMVHQAKLANIEILACNVSDTNVLNVGINQCYRSASGILTVVYESNNVKIKDCMIKDTQIVSEKSPQFDNVNVSGIFALAHGTNDVIIDNCDMSNVELDNKDEYGTGHSNNTAGILASAVNTKGKFDIVNCDVDNINVHAMLGNVGGIFGCTSNTNLEYLNIENCNVKNSEIISEAPYVRCGPNSNTGGIVATANNTVLKMKDSNFINSAITGSGCNTAAIIGSIGNFSNGKTNIIQNCKVEDSEVMSNTRYLEAYGNCVVSGAIAQIQGNAIIEKCDVLNTKIEGKGAVISGILSDGLNEGVIEFLDCNVIGCELTDENMEDPNPSMTMAKGGIAAVVYNGKYENCVVKDTNMHFKAMSIGGIVGWGNSAINNCTVENVKIYGERTIKNQYYGSIGGIIGDMENRYYGNIDVKGDIVGCKVKDTYIETGLDQLGGIIGTKYSEGNIKDCTIENVELKNTNKLLIQKDYQTGIGGIMAVNSQSNVKITNPTINGLTIIAEEGENDIIQTGGIVGAGYKIEIDNANITNLNITNNTPNGLVGGIVGVSSDTLNNANTSEEISITNSNISDSILKGLNHIGGCIGFTTLAEISETTVNNTSLTTSEETGIVGGFVGVATNNEKEISSGTMRNSKVTITDSRLIDVVKTGLNYVNEFIGLGVIENINTVTE